MNNYYMYFRLISRDLMGHKIRSLLTMLGIIIGISSVIIIMSVGAGAQSLITGSIRQMGTNLLGVIPGASSDNGPPATAYGIVTTTLTYDDGRAIARLSNVVGISAYARGVAEIVYESTSMDGNFSGITSDYPFVENHLVERGRFFTAEEERSGSKLAVLGADIKITLFPYDDPIGKKIRINKENYNIIGVMKKKGSSLVNNPDNQVFVPLITAQRLLLGIHHVNLVRIKVDNERNVDMVQDQVKRLLRHRHQIKPNEEDDFTVRSLAQALDVLTGVTDALKFFLACIAAVSLVVGGIGITNIMLMTVKERTREIGLKKAIGAKPSQIKQQFIFETLVLTGVGGILGIVVGVVISWLIALVVVYLDYYWEFQISLWSILIAFLLSLFVGLSFGLYPARKAAALNPIDALRYE